MKRIPLTALATACLAFGLAACKPAEAPAPAQTGPKLEDRQVMAVDTPPPEYPLAQFCNGVGGIVELEIGINTEGNVDAVRVVKSSGVPELDAAAQAATQKYKFQPAVMNGRLITKKIRVPVNFNPSKVADERCNDLIK